MTWSPPDGVKRPGLAKEVAKAVAAFSVNPGAEASSFLVGDARESWRVFISTFIQHSTATHLALGDLLASNPRSFDLGADDWTTVRKNALRHAFGKGVDDFAAEYYAATQALLQIRDRRTEIELFRGVAKHTAEVLKSDLAYPGYAAYLNLNPLSSWGTDIKLAERFAMRGGGMVVRKGLPPSMIFAHFSFDSLMEHLLERQIGQHLKGGIDEFGGEAIVWCPNCCIPIQQEDIVRDYTQVDKAKGLGGI